MLDCHAPRFIVEKLQRLGRPGITGQVREYFGVFVSAKRPEIGLVFLLHMRLQLRQPGHIFLNILRGVAVVEHGQDEVGGCFRCLHPGFCLRQKRLGKLLDELPLLAIQREIWVNWPGDRRFAFALREQICRCGGDGDVSDGLASFHVVVGHGFIRWRAVVVAKVGGV